jgi:TRAP-type transport system periplasmic protein
MARLIGRQWSRRDVGAIATSLMASGVIVKPWIAHAAAYTLKLSVFAPPSNGSTQELQRWAEALRTKTGGELEMQVFPSSQMGPPPRQYDLVRTGVADLAWVLYGFSPGRFPLIELSYLPGLFSDAKSGTRALRAITNYVAEENKGVRVLALTASPTLKVLTNKIPIASIGDFKGKRLRHPGAAVGETINALGATPVAVPPAEMGDALSKGVVDGIVTTYEAAASFKILDAVKFATDINLGVATLALVMNADSFAKLPAPLQKAVDDSAGEPLSMRLAEDFDNSEARALASTKEKVQQVEVNSQERDRFKAAFTRVIEARVTALADRGLPAHKVFEGLRAAAT